MRLPRSPLSALVALVVLAAVAVAAVLIFKDDGDNEAGPGRIAVIAGCGLQTMAADGSGFSRLCLSGIWAGVSVSGNGSTVAWDTSSGSKSTIIVAEVDGANPRKAGAESGANFQPSLSPDGGKLAFLHSSSDDGRYNVWTMSTSGKDSRRLTSNRNASAVAWSPKGDRIAYVAGWSPESLDGDVLVMNTSGGALRAVGRGDSPAWTPNGKRLAFAHAGGVWTVDADGKNRRLLVQNGRSPAWSRDGRLLAFMRTTRCPRPPCPEGTWVIPADGGTARAVGPAFPEVSGLLWLPS